MSWPAARQAEMQWGSNGKTPFCPCVIRKQLLGLLIWTWRWCNTWERSCRASRSSSQISWLKKKKCCHRRHRHHRRHHLHRHKMKNAKSVQRHFASLRAFWSTCSPMSLTAHMVLYKSATWGGVAEGMGRVASLWTPRTVLASRPKNLWLFRNLFACCFLIHACCISSTFGSQKQDFKVPTCSS